MAVVNATIFLVDMEHRAGLLVPLSRLECERKQRILVNSAHAPNEQVDGWKHLRLERVIALFTRLFMNGI